MWALSAIQSMETPGAAYRMQLPHPTSYFLPWVLYKA